MRSPARPTAVSRITFATKDQREVDLSKIDMPHGRVSMSFIKINDILNMFPVKLSEGGRVVIPAEIRKALGLKEGDIVLWELADGEARLTTRRERLRRAQALVRQYVPEGVSLVDELTTERRAEAKRE